MAAVFAVAGTSTGGILALALAKPYSADALSALYEEHGATICSKPRWNLGLYQGKYPSDGIESVLAAHFGGARLKTILYLWNCPGLTNCLAGP